MIDKNIEPDAFGTAFIGMWMFEQNDISLILDCVESEILCCYNWEIYDFATRRYTYFRKYTELQKHMQQQGWLQPFRAENGASVPQC